MLPLVAYTDKLSVAAGETLSIMASSFGAQEFRADLRRIIQGDTNPSGPGYKDELIDIDLGGSRPAVSKPFYPGSCVIVPTQGAFETLGDFTIAATVLPTLLDNRERCVISLFGSRRIGIDAYKRPFGEANGQRVYIDQPVKAGGWYALSLSFCSKT